MSDKLKVEEVYELSKTLFDSSVVMRRLDDNAADVLIKMSSDVLDLIDNTRFNEEEITEINELVKELDA